MVAEDEIWDLGGWETTGEGRIWDLGDGGGVMRKNCFTMFLHI